MKTIIQTVYGAVSMLNQRACRAIGTRLLFVVLGAALAVHAARADETCLEAPDLFAGIPDSVVTDNAVYTHDDWLVGGADMRGKTAFELKNFPNFYLTLEPNLKRFLFQTYPPGHPMPCARFSLYNWSAFMEDYSYGIYPSEDCKDIQGNTITSHLKVTKEGGIHLSTTSIPNSAGVPRITAPGQNNDEFRISGLTLIDTIEREVENESCAGETGCETTTEVEHVYEEYFVARSKYFFPVVSTNHTLFRICQRQDSYDL